jgi:hypothetical protein
MSTAIEKIHARRRLIGEVLQAHAEAMSVYLDLIANTDAPAEQAMWENYRLAAEVSLRHAQVELQRTKAMEAYSRASD